MAKYPLWVVCKEDWLIHCTFENWSLNKLTNKKQTMSFEQRYEQIIFLYTVFKEQTLSSDCVNSKRKQYGWVCVWVGQKIYNNWNITANRSRNLESGILLELRESLRIHRLFLRQLIWGRMVIVDKPLMTWNCIHDNLTLSTLFSQGSAKFTLFWWANDAFDCSIQDQKLSGIY